MSRRGLGSIPRLTALTALALAATACRSPTSTRCDICNVKVRVVGTVETSSGTPVEGVDVETAPLYGDPCGASSDPAPETEKTTTDGQGAFEQLVEGISIGNPTCVLVRVAPPAEAGLRGAADTLPAEFALPDEPPETVTARFVLEPR